MNKPTQEIFEEMSQELVKTAVKNRGEVFRRFARIYNLELTKLKKAMSQKHKIRKLPTLFL